MNNKKEIFMFAGPNGSGKSTIITGLMENGSCPSNYICPDSLIDQDVLVTKEKYIEAMQKAEVLRNNAIIKGESFTFETVLSTQDKIDFLMRAKDYGYRITTVYITTGDYNINIKRVRKRVKEGGHNVPTQSIIDRYHRSMKLMSDALKLSDDFFVFDNSGATPVLVIEYQKGTYKLNRTYKNTAWVNDYIITPCGYENDKISLF